MGGLLKPLSQHVYGMPMEKCKGMEKEAKYIWKMGTLNKQALCASPCLLADKAGG